MTELQDELDKMKELVKSEAIMHDAFIQMQILLQKFYDYLESKHDS